MWAFVYFDQSKLIFDQSKIMNKLFLKKSDLDLLKPHFSKVLKLFSLSLRFELGSTSNFCHFLPKFLQGFPLSKSVCPYYPLLFIYFQFYMHFFMHWRVIFGPCINWGFWCIKPYFVKLINGFCCYIDIFLNYDSSFDQFGVLW